MPHSRIEIIKFRVLLFPLLLCLNYTAFAQVYKSTDAEGNVSYSDTPSTGSEAVQVQETNVADPVKVPENATPAPAPEPTVTKQEAPPEDEISADDDDDDDDDNYRDQRRAAKRLAQRHKNKQRRR